MYLKLLTASVLLCLAMVVHCEKVAERFTLPREGYRLTDNNVTEEHTCTSLTACISVCSHLSWCLTASFNAGQDRCLLGIVRVTHDKYADKYLIAETNWITLSKAFYTVFQRIHSTGRYKATYADAITMCNDKNTIIASEADLLESRALGLNWCGCGWLSNGRNGFVLQNPDWFCWGSFNASVLYCDYGKANVWCKL